MSKWIFICALCAGFLMCGAPDREMTRKNLTQFSTLFKSIFWSTIPDSRKDAPCAENDIARVFHPMTGLHGSESTFIITALAYEKPSSGNFLFGCLRFLAGSQSACGTEPGLHLFNSGC
jgi:hypothetical protein